MSKFCPTPSQLRGKTKSRDGEVQKSRFGTEGPYNSGGERGGVDQPKKVPEGKGTIKASCGTIGSKRGGLKYLAHNPKKKTASW